MELNRLSVIIPFYNSGSYLKETIDSVVNQLNSEDELILIDDGSGDDSLAIAEKYKEKYDNIVVVHESNHGVSFARNLGLKKCSKEYVLFIDSDDKLKSESIRIIKENLSSNDLVIFGFDKVIRTKSVSEVIHRSIVSGNLSGGIKGFVENLKAEDEDVFLNYIWNRVYKTQVLKENDIAFNEELSLGEDFVFNIEYIKNCKKIKVLDDCLYEYICRDSNNSLTGKFHNNEVSRRVLMQSAYIGLLESLECSLKAYKVFYIVEGCNCINSMKAINKASCKLDNRGKIQYIKGFLLNPCRNYIISYLSESPGFKNKMLYLFVKTHATILVYFSIVLNGRLKTVRDK